MQSENIIRTFEDLERAALKLRQGELWHQNRPELRSEVEDLRERYLEGAFDKTDRSLRWRQLRIANVDYRDFCLCDKQSFEKAQRITRADIIHEETKSGTQMNKTALEKRNRNFIEAVKDGKKIVEKSLSKVVWDIGSEKIIVTGNQRLDYQVIWALHCASDFVANDEWFGEMAGLTDRKKSLHEESGNYYVVIPYKRFKDFVGRDISVQEAIGIFRKLPKVILLAAADDRSAKLLVGGKWTRVPIYEDNICGVAIAQEREKYDQYRSDETIERGPSAGTEEPVFVLFFSSLYGKAFVKSAKERKGCRLQDTEMYRLNPRAQELYEAVRWRGIRDVVILNMERISTIVGWKWPIDGRKKWFKRKEMCQKILDILYEEGFITRPMPKGKKLENIHWVFYVRQKRDKKALR